MPELPEVEVTRRGIAPHLLGATIRAAIVRDPRLRQPVPAELAQQLADCKIVDVARRGKYLLLGCARGRDPHGTLIIHLGMTGTLRIYAGTPDAGIHDHVDLVLAQKTGRAAPLSTLRYRDPRRFGAMLWHPASAGPVLDHPALAGLGVEPLGPDFAGEAGGALLWRASRGRRQSVKALLLGGQVVVGVGNIYCSEALFRAGIRPTTAVGRISLVRWQRLADEIRATLTEAIGKGGSTLRDFVDSDGASGYFQIDAFVYDRARLPCRRCATPIKQIVQQQRSTYYCPQCQR